MPYHVYAECCNCGWAGDLEVSDGQLVTKQECPICKCTTLVRTSSELYSLIKNPRITKLTTVTTKLESSKYTSVAVECPECKTLLLVLSLKEEKARRIGRDVCALCGCIFQWERVD